MTSSTLVLSCQDQQKLAACFYCGDQPKAMVVIGSALGVSQHYYKRFAGYLVEQGFNVLTFDYRFTGDSAALAQDALLQDTTATNLLDWGRQDIEAALQFALNQALPIYFIGHSIGGQLLGLAPSASQLRKVAFVASSAPYWRRWSFPGNLKLGLMAKLVFPLVSSFKPQFPCKTFGLGNIDIPSPLIRQWASWMLKPDYLFEPALGHDTGNYQNLNQEILSLGFSDDELVPEANLQHLLGFYPNANTRADIITPASAGMSTIGHTGFFREAGKDALWPLMNEWFSVSH